MRPAPPQLPPGFMAQWPEEQKAYFYVNEITKESTWVLPAVGTPTVAAGSIVLPIIPAQVIGNVSGLFNGGSYEIQHR
ncbi:UNVERIFIED_CONTAM: hypothetical protein HDU68_010232 [Siphonaria sp. JEL0065]|nr:hypothetical protein HDU68_010232 [Siphonaria sp. JEL0065]